MFLGELLVSKGLVSKSDVKLALEKQQQMAIPLGKTAVDVGYLTMKENLQLLMEQIETGKSFEELVLGKELLTGKEIDELRDIRLSESSTLGQILMEMTSVSKLQVILTVKELMEINGKL